MTISDAILHIDAIRKDQGLGDIGMPAHQFVGIDQIVADASSKPVALLECYQADLSALTASLKEVSLLSGVTYTIPTLPKGPIPSALKARLLVNLEGYLLAFLNACLLERIEEVASAAAGQANG